MAAEYPTITKCFLDAVDNFANPRAQMYRTQHGSQAAVWESISAKEMLRRVAGLSRALAELGIQPGDRVGLFAPNCPEWAIADFAIQGLGAVSVPVYFNESLDRLTYILNDSGARVVFTSGEDAGAKNCRVPRPVAGARARDFRCASRRPAWRNPALRSADRHGGDADIAQYRSRAAEVTGKQLATIIYTSGTTGEPKGVMLTHANLTSNALDSASDFETLPGDLALSFLPLAHVYERVDGLRLFFRGVSVAYVEQIETVPQALLEVHPTMVAAVPRFYEKIYANIIEQGHRETGLKREIFDWALRVATQAVPWRAYGKQLLPWSVKCAGDWPNRSSTRKFAPAWEGRIRAFSSGGAPLARELRNFSGPLACRSIRVTG